MENPSTIKLEESSHPEFIRIFFDSYRAKEAHVFIFHGNVSDFPNNSGRRGDLRRALALSCDTPTMLAECKTDEQKAEVGKVQRILAYYTIANGLEFASPESNNLWRQIMKQYIKDVAPGTTDATLDEQVKDLEKPINLESALNTMNIWFTASKRLHQNNQKVELQKKGNKLPDPLFTVVFFDGDAMFPNGPMSQLNMDRAPIVNVRNWARDEALGNKNRVIIVTRHLTEIHESIRGGESGVRAILIPKPTMKDREEWLNNFDSSLQERAKKGTPQKLGGKDVTHIEYAPGFDAHTFAIQAAGLSRKQMENIFMRAALDKEPIDFPLVRALKTKALEEEYGGLVDFREPEYGFDKIGGHEHLKRYFQRKIIAPLKKGDKRTCSRGVLLTGPPGCQPAGSKVLMEDGTWKNVENVKVGDRIISPQQDGTSQVSNVIETVVYDNRPIYEVATLGRSRKSYRCADNHILPYLTLKRPRTMGNYKYEGQQGKDLSIFPSKRLGRHTELEEKQVRDFLKRGKNYRNKSRIFTSPAVQFPEQSFDIPPYVLGCMLGDGSFFDQPNFTNSNPTIFERLVSFGLEFGYENKKGITYSKNIINGFADLFRKSELWGRDSHSKFVPQSYKTAALGQRLDLLAGLIDTDGSKDSYTSCSKQLAEDFEYLVHSVGGFANIKPRITKDQNGTECLSYRVFYSFAEFQPVLLESHKQQGTRNLEWKNPRNRNFEVNYVGVEKVYGFVLDSPSEWYVTNDWIVTHNTGKTAITLAMAKEAGVNFMIAHLARLFGGLVGETESNTQKFIEAADSAAPVIVFIDELESVLSAGRSSVGDSGTSSRVFNSIMTWLSDESRSGRIVVVGATNRPDLLDSALIRSGRFDAILPALPPQSGDAKGRLEILKALTKKQNFKFEKGLQATLESKDAGIGKMLHDPRIWTGAEMEVVLKEAIDNAIFADRTAVSLEDWDQAFKDVLPSTREVDKMIDLSLYYVNHLGYCPEDWRDRAMRKQEIANAIKTDNYEETAAHDREI